MSKVITFAHPKGGVGKSMLAFNYSAYLLKKRKKFCIIDLDGQHSITNFNNIRKEYNLPSFDIKHFNESSSLIDFIQNNNYDFIVIDTGGFDSSLNRVVLALSDVIITPVSDSPVETLRLFDFNNNILSDIAREMKIDELKAHIVLNRIHSSVKNIEAIKEPYKECKNFTFLQSVIRDRARYKFSISGGNSIFEESKSDIDERAIEEIKNLFKEIDNLITKE